MTPLSIRKRRIILILCVLAFVIILPALALYTIGYRLEDNFALVKTGGLYISAPVTGTSVYLDGLEINQTSFFQNGFLIQNLKPKSYTIITYKDGYWPWSKKLKVEESLVTEGRAILVPTNPKIVLVEKISDEYKLAMKTFSPQIKTATTTFTEFANHNRERLMLDKKQNLLALGWLGENQDLPYFFCADLGCDATTTIIKASTPIRWATFYPGRNDVVIVAIQNGIYAVEIDKRGGQLLQPIYKGFKPYFFVPAGENFLYVFDEGTLAKIFLAE